MVALHGKVLLQSGEKAIITEILKDGKIYAGEIHTRSGEIEIDFISADMIKSTID